MKLAKISTIIMMVLVVGLVGAFEAHPAQANFLKGGVSYKVLFTSQNGVYVIAPQNGENQVKGCVLIASGDHIPGPTDLRVNGVYYTTLNPEPKNREKDRRNGRMAGDKNTYEFSIPIRILRTDGLPNTVEAWSTTYRPWSKDHTKTGKWEKNFGAAATATFVLQKVAVHSPAEEEAIAMANAKAQLGRTNSSDADTLAGFFESSASASASASTSTDSGSATANTSASATSSGGFDGQAGNTDPAIQTQPARQSGDLILQFRVGQYQTIRLIDPNGRQVGPNHSGRANNDNGGAIIIGNDQLPLGGSVVVIAQTSSDRGMMQRTIPIPFGFGGRTVDFR